MNLKAKLAIICAVLTCVAGVLWMATARQRSLTTLTYSQFLEQVRAGRRWRGRHRRQLRRHSGDLPAEGRQYCANSPAVGLQRRHGGDAGQSGQR